MTSCASTCDINLMRKGDSAESALNRVLRDLSLPISTYIFAVMTAEKAKNIQASWAKAKSSHPD
jgi:hypothetical protein